MDEQFKINGEKAENDFGETEYRDEQPTENGYKETIISLKPKKPKALRWQFFLAALGIIMVAELSYLAWNNYLGPQAKYNRETKANYDAYMKVVNQYEAAMKNDTYGGKTPQETLDMFVDALKKGDIELASKYFVLREDGSRDPEITASLEANRDADNLSTVIKISSSAKPAGSSLEGYYGFEAVDDSGEIFIIDFVFNKYSQVWKIEEM